jgi:hypothetical protein
MKSIYITLFTALFLCFACKQEKVFEGTTLSVDIDRRDKVSLFDLFHRVELIPLETTDESLIKEIRKVICANENCYVLDYKQQILFCFDGSGKFVRQISKRGEGPEEFLNIRDFSINESAQTIEILSPTGAYRYSYDYAGKLLDKYILKGKIPHYQCFIDVSDSLSLYWSLTSNETTPQVYVYSKEKKAFIDEFYRDKPILNTMAQSVFFKFAGKSFYYKPFYSEVYAFDENRLTVDYKWDFGAKTMSIQTYDIPEGDDQFKLIEPLQNGSIPYFFNEQMQTDLYYYTRIVSRLKTTTHIFYDKRNHAVRVFDRFEENVLFNPVFWCNDYVLGFSSPFYSIDRLVTADILDEAGRQHLQNLTEDDNPCLIKYYFKKNE